MRYQLIGAGNGNAASSEEGGVDRDEKVVHQRRDLIEEEND